VHEEETDRLRAEICARYQVTEGILAQMNARDCALHLALHDEVFTPWLAQFRTQFTIVTENPHRAEYGLTVVMDGAARSQAAFDAVWESAAAQGDYRRVRDRFTPTFQGDAPLTVRASRCAECLYSSGHLPRTERIRPILQRLIADHNSCFVCHHHNDEQIVCRGFFDAHPEIANRATLVERGEY
jgi:hypothetical protein